MGAGQRVKYSHNNWYKKQGQTKLLLILQMVSLLILSVSDLSFAENSAEQFNTINDSTSEIYHFATSSLHKIAGHDAKTFIKSILKKADLPVNEKLLVIDYPFDGSIFPPEIIAPTFIWHDNDLNSILWLIDISLNTQPHHIYVLTEGTQCNPVIDPRAISDTNKEYKRSDYDLSAKHWTPAKSIWQTVKEHSQQNNAVVTIYGISNGPHFNVTSRQQIKIKTSINPVGSGIFYRDVPLMPSELEEGVIKPIATNALPLISWRLRDISMTSASVVLEDMPTCGNCHTFSRDGKILGMDMDGPGGDKGAYTITEVKKDIVITHDDIITWNSYEHTPAGHKNFGLFSQVSPDGRYVVSTLNESTFVANYPDFRFLQSFYPTRGILVVYDRETKQMNALPGADDPAYVHTNACWNPDGTKLVFSRAPAKNNYESNVMPRRVSDKNETFIQYDLFTIDFNKGQGGKPKPLEGACSNGMSNSFPRYSPDGKWIVFVQSEKGQLMRPDSKLYIINAEGGQARKMKCNLDLMNSWHSWSPNSRWLVFASKGFSPFTQMFLTHIDEDGSDSPAILVPYSTADNRAVNIPEFLGSGADSIVSISTPTQESYRYYNQARELAKSGKLEQAMKKLEQSLELHPYYALAHHDKGFVLFKMDRKEEAIKCFRKAIELDPYCAEAYNSLGFLTEIDGDTAKAMDYYYKALKIKPRMVNAHMNLGNIFRMQNKLNDAENHHRQAIAIKPYLGETHNNLGVVLQAQGKHEQAIDCYLKALEVEPNYAQAQYNLGLVLKALNNNNQSHIALRAEIANKLLKQGDRKTAVEQFRIVLKAHPKHIGVLNSLAWTLATNTSEDNGNYIEAVMYAQKAAELTAFKQPQVLDTLAAAYAASGNFGKAIKTAEDAIKLAQGTGDMKLSQRIENRVKLYRQGKAHKE